MCELFRTRLVLLSTAAYDMDMRVVSSVQSLVEGLSAEDKKNLTRLNSLDDAFKFLSKCADRQQRADLDTIRRNPGLYRDYAQQLADGWNVTINCPCCIL
ncbi:unnamed protein product [Rotaria sordida]|uniref:Uncharacterized protein n=1 Tax=Rotaria sordida TaxID=392033 RepID=A0A815G1A6_9BILA|nr:unnamed protein product [Rotaria sordida]